MTYPTPHGLRETYLTPTRGLNVTPFDSECTFKLVTTFLPCRGPGREGEDTKGVSCLNPSSSSPSDRFPPFPTEV